MKRIRRIGAWAVWLLISTIKFPFGLLGDLLRAIELLFIKLNCKLMARIDRDLWETTLSDAMIKSSEDFKLIGDIVYSWSEF